jgi:hypothetical protein
MTISNTLVVYIRLSGRGVGEGWARGGRGVGEGGARGGVITSFNIYISHLTFFTSKISKIYDGLKIAGFFC